MVNNNGMNPTHRSAPIQLSEAPEGQFPEEVELVREGVFTDPRYGKFPVTRKMLADMVANFKKKIRGIRPAIDFKHDSDAEAAAWLTDVFIKEKDGKQSLWAKPDWTGEGKRKLSDRVYGYLSADFQDNYRDNEEGKVHGCVLLGAALTNRPVIKNMQPVIQLSESNNQGAKVNKQLNEQDLQQVSALMEKMGVSSVEDLIKKIAELKADAPSVEVEAMEKKLGDMEKKLSEQATKITTLETEKKTSEKTNEFNKMLAESKVCEAQRAHYMAGDMVKFAEAAQPLNAKPAGTEGGKNPKEDESGDEQDKVLKLAEEKVKNKEASDIGSAISMVLKEQKEAKK